MEDSDYGSSKAAKRKINQRIYSRILTNEDISRSSVVKICSEKCEDDCNSHHCYNDDQSVRAILKQALLPFFIGGSAMVVAGLYFDSIQEQEAFKKVTEINVIVPALFGLKGNLDMTLASRLSTDANLGLLNNSKDYVWIILGNITLVQLQAITIACLICSCGTALIYLDSGELIQEHIFMLFACCFSTAAIASLILTFVITLIIILSLNWNIDPDNVATPIAASLGDISSILLISVIATTLYKTIDNKWVSIIIVIFFILLLPLLVWVAKTNRHTSNVVTAGWIPVILSMLISTIAGISLKTFMAKYRTLPAFQPVISGVGGNLISIQASRLSTNLHMKYHLGQLPENIAVFISPFQIFYGKDSYSVTSRVLLALTVLGQLIFAIVIILVSTSFPLQLGCMFVVFYVLAAFIQVYILICVAYILTHYVWKWNINPDTTTIPYLTALGDLLGIVFLGAVYSVLDYFGMKEFL